MIHELTTRGQAPAASCGCHAHPPARLGFADLTAGTETGGADWHWILIAALAALVIFQAIDKQGKRR